MDNKKLKVVVGLSGGVDSAVSAALLLEQGYEVIGVFMHFWSENTAGKIRDNVCCSLDSKLDAQKVARQLNIPFYVLTLDDVFKDKVVDGFIEEYRKCATPNPCVVCNKYIKFGEFIKKAKMLFNADYVATGHYAQINPKSSPRFDHRVEAGKIQSPKTRRVFSLVKSKDEDKDQTYFLHQLSQEQLSHILFPVGHLKKEQVRQLAAKFNLAVAGKRESQEICFIPDGNLSNFLKRHLTLHKGEIKDVETGQTIGRHDGLAEYTVGQRKGIKLSGGPWYVARLDAKNNVLWVSKNEKDLQSEQIFLDKVNWVEGVIPKLPLKVHCKVRYRSPEVACLIDFDKEKNNYIVKFEIPERAVTKGQYCVFYKGKVCLGGGKITNS